MTELDAQPALPEWFSNNKAVGKFLIKPLSEVNTNSVLTLAFESGV